MLLAPETFHQLRGIYRRHRNKVVLNQLDLTVPLVGVKRWGEEE